MASELPRFLSRRLWAIDFRPSHRVYAACVTLPFRKSGDEYFFDIRPHAFRFRSKELQVCTVSVTLSGKTSRFLGIVDVIELDNLFFC